MTTFTLLAILAGIVSLILLFIWLTYNTFVRLQNQVKADFSDIDVQVKRRASLIQNLADMVQAYAKHEKETFEEVAKARSAVDRSKNASDFANAENMLTQTLRSLFAVVENYPKLRASENFQSLQAELKRTEDMIAIYREEYNRSVQQFNNTIQTFPNLLVAAIFGYLPMPFFQESSVSDNKVVI